MSRQTLEHLSTWKNDALNDDVPHLYFRLPIVDQVLNGQVCFVTGRKGTGKTALARHIQTRSHWDVFVKTLSFRNFPLEELDKLKETETLSKNRYATAWECLIHTALLDCFRQNNSINPDTRKAITDVFGSGGLADLLTNATRFGATVGLPYLKVETRNVAPRQLSPSETLQVLKNAVSENVDSSSYYILIDNLDEDYKFFEDRGKLYNELMVGLFRAVMSAKAFYGQLGARVFPVAFLRTDIFVHLKDNNRNSWSDFSGELRWTEPLIKQALAHRIHGEGSSDCLGSTDEALRSVIDIDARIGSSKGRDEPVLRYIERCGQCRIRDSIMFFRYAASTALELGKEQIDVPTIRQSEEGYSNYLRREIEDEMFGVMPRINEYLRVFSIIGRNQFRLVDFFNATEELSSELDDKALKAGDLLDKLFQFNVVGNQGKRELPLFYYQALNARLNKNDSLCVHRGLLKALYVI